MLIFHAERKTLSGLVYVKGKIAQEHSAIPVIRLQFSGAYGLSAHVDGHIGIHMHGKLAALKVDSAGFGGTGDGSTTSLPVAEPKELVPSRSHNRAA